MNELRKLVFEKIKFDKLKMSKSDYAVLVEKGLELGIEEAKVKKLVSSCLKRLKTFKGETLPMSILEERNVELEAEELCIPAETMQTWCAEVEDRLKELEKVLASNDPEMLQSFLAENPEMEAVSKVPLSKFVKTLHKDVEAPSQESVPEPEVVEEDKEEEKQDPAPTTSKKLPVFLIAGVAAGIAAIMLIAVVIVVIIASKPKVEDFLNESIQYQTFIDVRDKQQYYSIVIGDQEWIAQNMNYATANSLCDSCKLYGRLYTYEEAMSACPDGYSIPTRNDINLLRSRIGGSNSLISKKLGGFDDYGFSSVTAGFFSAQDHVVKRRGEIHGFWLYDETMALALRAKIEANNALDISPLKKDYGFSVRCIRTANSIRDESAKLLIDNRDRKTYETSMMGNRRWMNQNLNYRARNSFCYNDDTLSCSNFGRLYDFETADKVCPDGWRLPDSADIAGLTKWIPQYGGFRDAKGVYALAGERADFWTAAEHKKSGVYWYIQNGGNGVNFATFSKTAAMSVRCVELTAEELEDIQAEIDRAALEAADRAELEQRQTVEESASVQTSESSEEKRAEMRRQAEEERAEMQRRAEEERLEKERRAEEERAEMERRAEEERAEMERRAEEERAEMERRAEEERAARLREVQETQPTSGGDLGVVKIASVKSISIYYDGWENIFTPEDVNAFLRKNKAPLLSIYRRLLSSRSEFETTVKFRLTVDLNNGKIYDVEDVSKESNLAEDGHVLLFKQVGVTMRTRWRFLPQRVSGTAVVEFPIRFQLQ